MVEADQRTAQRQERLMDVGPPLLSTKRMPVKQARSGTRGRPPLGLGGSGVSSGATMTQSTSGRRGLLMALVYHAATGFERHSNITVPFGRGCGDGK